MRFHHNMRRLCCILCVLLTAIGLTSSSSCSWEEPVDPDEPQAWTLAGTPLYAPTWDGLVGAGLDAQLAMAREHTVPDPATYAWLGRRLAYKWWNQPARCIFSYAVERWPTFAPLWRHRGHNFLSTRNFTQAEADLQQAAVLIQQQHDKDGWEADGKPNQYNLPLYSRHYNIYYHLGLSRYLQGNFTGAVEAYNALWSIVENEQYVTDDAWAAAVYWKYMALRRAGYDETSREVQETLAVIHGNMTMLDVDTYYQLCLFYKGLRPEPDLTKLTDPLDFTTVAYGVGNYHYYNRRTTKAISIWKRVVQNQTYWPAFGFIAAEADLYRVCDTAREPLSTYQ